MTGMSFGPHAPAMLAASVLLCGCMQPPQPAACRKPPADSRHDPRRHSHRVEPVGGGDGQCPGTRTPAALLARGKIERGHGHQTRRRHADDGDAGWRCGALCPSAAGSWPRPLRGRVGGQCGRHRASRAVQLHRSLIRPWGRGRSGRGFRPRSPVIGATEQRKGRPAGMESRPSRSPAPLEPTGRG